MQSRPDLLLFNRRVTRNGYQFEFTFAALELSFAAMRSWKLFSICASCVAVAFLLTACRDKRHAGGDGEFLRLSNVGKAQLDRGDAPAAVATFEKALKLEPAHPAAKLNLANALLLAEQNERALALAKSVAESDRNNAAALYVAGVAENRLRNFTEAVKFLTETKNLDKTLNPVSFQLGLAYEGLTNYSAALQEYEEIEQFEPDFPALHYRLAQLYLRTNRQADAAKQMDLHKDWLARHASVSLSAAALERCKYTQAHVPFQLEQPDEKGIHVTFKDVSREAFAQKFTGPVGVIDFARDGRNHLLVGDGASFRLLVNSGGKFQTNGQSFPFTNGGGYSRWLVADLNKDGTPDALVLGDRGVHLYRFTTNGFATETTAFAGLKNFAARDAVFADLSFRSDLDVIAVSTNGELRVMSNLQNMYFVDTTTNLPALKDLRGLAVDDWNNDEVQDLFVATSSGPSLWVHQRGGGFTNASDKFPSGTVFAVGDMNNDLRSDLVAASSDKIEMAFAGNHSVSVPLNGFVPKELRLIDYDNDGWLDVVVIGNGIRIWRNAGARGLSDATAALGLDQVKGRVDSLAAADFDGDCDTDLALNIDGEVHLLRNDGGNANKQLKLQLRGTRSNPSALGTRIEISTAGLRAARRVTSLPIEIGVGKHERVDAVTVQWIELTTTQEEVPATCGAPLALLEPALPTGSCPYLYAWDGERFRFVTDILGSAPLGLPIAPGKYIEADEDEMVALGNDSHFKPRGNNYVVQLTEELREVLYLDEVKLVVVDHPPGTEVHTTDQLRARRPAGGFPRGEILTLGSRMALRSFERASGVSPGPARQDAGGTLAEIDGALVSPKLREPQYRGLAEPLSLTLDFGVLDTRKPLVLALTGWLRFGGGTANIAASSRTDFPFPFPMIEAELANGEWKRVDVEVGAPSGKTKTIIVDLANKLPEGTKRLRLSAAFEIHWDRIAMFEKLENATSRIVRLTPTRSHLHWRGYSEFADQPWNQPLTPVYNKLKQQAPWLVTPSGWATRYGEVDELLRDRDNALAMIAGGDELTVEFSANSLPTKPESLTRDFFLFTSGWDKDSDYHVVSGTTLEPLPWHGLDDQIYGIAPRPQFTNDGWIQKYNTRWVGPRVTARISR